MVYTEVVWELLTFQKRQNSIQNDDKSQCEFWKGQKQNQQTQEVPIIGLDWKGRVYMAVQQKLELQKQINEDLLV